MRYEVEKKKVIFVHNVGVGQRYRWYLLEIFTRGELPRLCTEWAVIFPRSLPGRRHYLDETGVRTSMRTTG